MEIIPADWLEKIVPFISEKEIAALWQSTLDKREKSVVYPPENLVFNALKLTPYPSVRAVILGQDPYFGEGEAHGLAFSVPDLVKLPPTLKNIFREYQSDLGREIPESGNLSNWAKNGVLLLNSVLTVEAGKPASHAKLGWQKFTDAVIRAVDQKEQSISFILWGSFAQSKAQLISGHHTIISSVHPSPLAAYRGFFGSKPFSKAERSDWSWPEL